MSISKLKINPIFASVFLCLALGLKSSPAAGRMFSKEAIEYRLKGYKASQNKDYDEAIKYLQKAGLLDPYYASPHNELGIIYELKGWLEKAEGEYLKALSIDPNNAEAVMNLGLFYEARGLVDKAVPYFQRRIELGPQDDPWARRAKSLLSKYAPALYKEITQKEEARNLMYQALEDRNKKKPSTQEETWVEEESITKAVAKEPEFMTSEQVENYLRLERDLVNQDLKDWLIGLPPSMVKVLYGEPSQKKVISASGQEITQPEWFNRWIDNLDLSTQTAREVYHQEGMSLFKEKWIYKIPAKYKKYALKPRIVLIFDNGRLSSWEK